jgi:hypothetical protein
MAKRTASTKSEGVYVSRITSDPQDLRASVDGVHFFWGYGPKERVHRSLNIFGKYAHAPQGKTSCWANVGREAALDSDYANNSQIIGWRIPGVGERYFKSRNVPSFKLQSLRAYDFRMKRIDFLSLVEFSTASAHIRSIRNDECISSQMRLIAGDCEQSQCEDQRQPLDCEFVQPRDYSLQHIFGWAVLIIGAVIATLGLIIGGSSKTTSVLLFGMALVILAFVLSQWGLSLIGFV